MRALERHELVGLFHRYIALPSTRKMAGDIFEAHCHVNFSTRIQFEFDGTHWRSDEKQSCKGTLTALEFWRSKESKALVSVSAKTISLSTNPAHVVAYNTGSVSDGLQVQADVYCMSLKANQVGLTHTFYTTLYLLQMTTFAVHPIKANLALFLQSLKGLPSQRRWQFIFVKPPRLYILPCPVPNCAELRTFFYIRQR